MACISLSWFILKQTKFLQLWRSHCTLDTWVCNMLLINSELINLGETWWCVEAGILGPGDQEDSGGRGCGAVHQASADKPWGFGWDCLPETVTSSHLLDKEKVQESSPWDEFQAQKGKAMTGHLVLSFLHHDCSLTTESTWQWWATRKLNPGV